MINLGDIVLARSLTYHPEKGLYINVIPNYSYEWFIEYDNGCWVNKDGGLYHYDGNDISLVASNTDGIFHSAFDKNGNLYAIDPYGKVLILTDSEFEVLVEGLFVILKNVSISELSENIIYVTTFGGGTYKINLSKL
jgi:hypothetical protein